MTTSAAECMEIEYYSKLLSAKNGPFRVVETTPTTMTIHEESIRNTVFVDRATVTPKAKQTPTEDKSTKTDDTDAEPEKRSQRTRKWKRKMSPMGDENTPWIAQCVMWEEAITSNYVVRSYSYK